MSGRIVASFAIGITFFCVSAGESRGGTFNWVSPTDGGWNDQNNWDVGIGFPGCSDDARYLNTGLSSTIEVTGDECCASYVGAPGGSRKVEIQAGDTLTVGSGGFASSSSSDYTVDVDDGGTLDIAGSLENVKIVGIPEDVTLTVGGDIIDSKIQLGDGAAVDADSLIGDGSPIDILQVNGGGDIDIASDVIGYAFSLVSASATLTVDILGDGGSAAEPLESPWYMVGENIVLIVYNDYIAEDEGAPFSAVVTIRDGAEMLVNGDTIGAEWVIDNGGGRTGLRAVGASPFRGDGNTWGHDVCRVAMGRAMWYGGK